MSTHAETSCLIYTDHDSIILHIINITENPLYGVVVRLKLSDGIVHYKIITNTK